MADYYCTLHSNREEDEALSENVRADTPKQAANFFRLRLQGLGRGPADISVSDKEGRWTVFSWDLKEKKEG